ncbi:hypothetical protein SAMN05444679_11080 [Variovorax sp. CF079]|nr:hypothetical protein SAMN05444679_11080 [Variovorax sp. CF079]
MVTFSSMDSLDGSKGGGDGCCCARHSMPCDSSSAISRPFSARSVVSSSLSAIESMLDQQVVHVVTNAVTQVVAEASDSIQAPQ